MVPAKGLVEGKTGTYYLMGVSFRVAGQESSRALMPNNANVLKTTETAQLQMVKMVHSALCGVLNTIF